MVHWSLLLSFTGRLWNLSKFVLTLTNYEGIIKPKEAQGGESYNKTVLVTETV